MSNKTLLTFLALTGCLLGCSTAPPKTVDVDRIVERFVDRPVPAAVAPFPVSSIPAPAPPSSKVRCEMLPPMALQPDKATVKQLLIEVQISRRSYADCAYRHNVLVDFNAKLEKGLLDVLNHYGTQIPRK